MILGMMFSQHSSPSFPKFPQGLQQHHEILRRHLRRIASAQLLHGATHEPRQIRGRPRFRVKRGEKPRGFLGWKELWDVDGNLGVSINWGFNHNLGVKLLNYGGSIMKMGLKDGMLMVFFDDFVSYPNGEWYDIPMVFWSSMIKIYGIFSWDFFMGYPIDNHQPLTLVNGSWRYGPYDHISWLFHGVFMVFMVTMVKNIWIWGPWYSKKKKKKTKKTSKSPMKTLMMVCTIAIPWLSQARWTVENLLSKITQGWFER